MLLKIFYFVFNTIIIIIAVAGTIALNIAIWVILTPLGWFVFALFFLPVLFWPMVLLGSMLPSDTQYQGRY